MTTPIVLDFRPHPWFRSGHAQTLAGLFLYAARHEYRAQRHLVDLDDGDQIVLHDDRPDRWCDGDRTALLIHGLVGCHRSGYMERIAAKLNRRSVRTFRMDQRGIGAGAGLAIGPAHAGRSEDATAAVEAISRLCPHSPTTVIGFSLGGNIALRLLAAASRRSIGRLDSGIAVAPPADLAACSRTMQQGANRLYNRYFVRKLHCFYEELQRLRPDAPAVELTRRVRSIWEFDDRVTAPLSGYQDATDYYRRASSGPELAEIRIPTQILAASDDPLVPLEKIVQYRRSPEVRLNVTPRGGHLGFLACRRQIADRRWLDQQVVRWVCEF